MDEILADAGWPEVDVLKIDIEGAERDIFACPKKWLKSVRVIIIELHGDYSVEAFRSDAAPEGFDVFAQNATPGSPTVIALRRKGA